MSAPDRILFINGSYPNAPKSSHLYSLPIPDHDRPALQPESPQEVSWSAGPANSEGKEMTIASDLLHQHIQTLVDDNARWRSLLADDVVWELAYAPSLGHPANLSGKAEAVRHATWFVGAVENFRFFDLNVYPFADPHGAVAE